MSYQDEIEKIAKRSGGSPVYQLAIGKREIYVLKIDALNKKVGWYVREGAMKNDKGPFRTRKAAIASIK
jgi:hypothetical protein